MRIGKPTASAILKTRLPVNPNSCSRNQTKLETKTELPSQTTNLLRFSARSLKIVSGSSQSRSATFATQRHSQMICRLSGAGGGGLPCNSSLTNSRRDSSTFDIVAVLQDEAMHESGNPDRITLGKTRVSRRVIYHKPRRGETLFELFAQASERTVAPKRSVSAK